jgi:hypothetical protein
MKSVEEAENADTRLNSYIIGEFCLNYGITLNFLATVGNIKIADGIVMANTANGDVGIKTA